VTEGRRKTVGVKEGELQSKRKQTDSKSETERMKNRGRK
jgi:hypothetical protein